MNIIDVSNVNGVVDWHRVYAAGVRGVYLKATEGATFDDGLFQSARRRAAAAGLRVGAYHFARPDHNSPKLEADHFCRVVESIGRRDLRPVLDFEQSAPKLHPTELEWWARSWNQRVLSRLGVLPAFYTYPWYEAHLELAKPIGNGLWLADYSVNDGFLHPAKIPAPWKKIILHQYTSRGKVDGVNGYVDLSYAPKLRSILAHPILGLL